MNKHKAKWILVGLLCLSLGMAASSCAPVSDMVQLSASAQRSFEEYRVDPKYLDLKAYAVHPSGRHWGWAQGYNTPQKAIDVALEYCHKQVAGCEIYAIGDTVVYGKSPKEIEGLVETYFETGGGKASSQFTLAFTYAEGWHVLKDYAQAANWYRRAAEQGHIYAQYNLGELYSLGNGVPESDTQALYWYQQSAEQGHVPAQYVMGHRHYLGLGTSKSYTEAHYWWSLASKAEFELAVEKRDEVAKLLTTEQLKDTRARVDNWLQQLGRKHVHPPQTWDQIFGK